MRSGRPFIVLGVAFLVMGFSQDRNALLGVGAAFLVLGIGMLAKGKRPK